MDAYSFNTKVEKKVEILKAIMAKREPCDPELLLRHEERINRAKQYLLEISSLVFGADEDIYIVSRGTFDDKLNGHDFCTIEEEGKYFCIAHIADFPKAYYIAWFFPLAQI